MSTTPTVSTGGLPARLTSASACTTWGRLVRLGGARRAAGGVGAGPRRGGGGAGRGGGGARGGGGEVRATVAVLTVPAPLPARPRGLGASPANQSRTSWRVHRLRENPARE